MTIKYNAGDALDTLAESFAGPHDWLSDRVGMYDAMGNGIARSGLNGALYETMSWGLIPVAAPFSTGALIATTPGVQNTLLHNHNIRQ